MRFAERFLIVFALIALGARLFALATAPVFLLLGFPALALYYLAAFPFTKWPAGLKSRVIAARVVSGAVLAFCLIGFLLYMLGWISRSDVLTNSCLLLTLLCVWHLISYRVTKSSFSLEVIIRAGAFLLVILTLILVLPPFSPVK